jgi:short-subunit dehydrogenase
MTQVLRALLASEEVTVHVVFRGPVDTDMTRGFEIPKASPESVQHHAVLTINKKRGWRSES